MIWLRLAVVGLLLAAVWGPSLPLEPVRTVVLLDQSPSARAATFALAPQLGGSGTHYLAFASGAAEVASPLARRLDLGEGTDLRSALEQAQRLRPDRILLVSDGLFQTEAPPSAVPIYGLYVAPSPNVSLSLAPPALPARGETVEVRAVLESTTSTRARLVVSGPAGTQTREVRVEPGRSSFGYRFRLDGPAAVTARLESPLGQKSARLELSPSDSTRVWVLGDPALARYLKAQGFAVEERDEVGTPINAEVVALGVGARDLGGGELDALSSFLRQGGSLLWTATPGGLFFGGWERSTLAEALPVEPLENPGGTGLVLVLDVSGSMAEADKLGLAVVGALELVRSARPQDYIGVVTFSDRQRWLFRPRPMTNQGRREAESLLLSLRPGGGTRVGSAHAEAVASLQNLPVDSRQVLALTDGLVEDPPEGLFQSARDAAPGTRTSTVALGSDAGRDFLRALAREGEGNFWDVPSPQDLPRFFLEEAQRNFRRESLEGRFPLSVRPHPVTRGLQPPPLSVVLPARAKPWAQEVLGSAEGAVLTLGESGRGRVAALATDLSRSWTGWNGAPALAGELMRWLSQTPARPRVQAVRDGAGVRVVLEGQFERPSLRYGGGQRPMQPVGALRYEARLPAGAVGEGVVLEGDQTRLRVELPRAPEWRLGDGKESLNALTRASGGALLSRPADWERLPARAPLNLTPLLLGLAALLFLAERWLERRRLGRAGLTVTRGPLPLK